MAGRHDKVMPETDESGSGSEVSIEDEEDGKGSDGDESDDTEEESESSEEEESSESDSSESDGESSSDDSDSTDSLWDAFDDGDKKETQEANEASALQEFQRALDCLVKGKNAVASKILKRLLENPLVKGFNTTVFDWEAEFDERLSKMARLFVGIHKNLAKLESEDSSHHFLQILSVAPKNAEIWLSLGLERIASGDLDFGKFAIEHAEGPAATDALLSALYLSRNFHACLRLAQKCLSTGVAREKALFLKEKIRSLNDHYREFSDKIFGENRRYDDVETLDEATTKKIAQRLFAVEERLREIQQTEEEISIPLPIDIEFDAEQTVQDVATCFCDLFDRIEAYSSLSLQEITFSRWDDRRDLLESSAIIEQMLDVVETVDSLVSQLPFLEESPPMESPERCRLDGNLPPVELAKFLGFRPRYIVPLKEELIKRPSRTPSPELHPDYIDADMLLYLLMTTLKGGSWVMFDLMEAFLCLVADISPAFGAIPPELREVVVQCYRRFNRMSSNLCEERYIRLHVLMDELGEAHARDYCIRWHYEERWTDRELLQRFILSHAKAITDENIKLAFLRHLYESLEDDEFVFTAKVFFKSNFQNVSLLMITISTSDGKSKVVAIISRDIDFHSMEDDDLFEMAGFLLEAYIKVENYDAAVDFASRLLHLLLSYKQVPEEKLFSVVESIKEVKWKRVEKDVAERMGYFLCQLVSIDSFTAEWQVWKELYRVAEHIGGGVSVEYIHSLDPLKQDEAMPSLGLDVLLKAHEKLGEAKKCGKDKGAFLLFFMEKLHDCIANETVVAVLRRDDFSWLWSNVSEEISQCLYCMFGRYSKRRRALEDHECSVSHVDLAKYSTMVVELAMPHPMPQYDDKDRLGHDVVDLLFNKFPTMLKYSEDRKNVMNDFTKWMREASKNGQANLLKWPTVKGESYVQACVWYLMALHHFRLNNYNETETYSKMDDDLLYLEWPWHVIPFRISLLVDSHIGVVYFQLANTLYQIGTRLSRYFLTVPSDDWHLLHSESLLLDLRKESLMLFEEALSRASHTETGGICEFQWLCYFFLAKLQAKLDPTDVVKIVDGMFEAACSCELSLFFYPIKINVKKQQNIEPVELHYQIHATVWKYLCETPSPPLKTLVTLVAYLRAMQYHKVDDLVTRVDLMEELWNLCHRGFELVCERFPHMKSYYRLAEMELSKGNVEAAYGHLIKHVFRRKKRDDSLFDSVVEITSQDIDRSGSFPYHVDRTLQLTMKLAYKLKDMSTLLCIITSLVSNIESRSEEFILKERQGALLQHAVGRLHILMMESATPKQLRFDLYRAWQAVVRCKTLAVRSAHNRLKKLIEHVFGSVDAFVAEHVVLEDHKKKQARKRKLTTYDLVAEDNSAEKGNASGEALNIATASSDPLKLMRLAYNV
ncbi:unnamed protein product [Nippostrongylus brasiliensis]|uniref:TPR_REGION domain-containing protein n=1 Tax=Nippostrongylus brasiliensis TaxID=27835 RepID=A0A158R2G1_NIPBR|nr:unnamed protein product [Nippostrongylus brasiliensis]